MRAVALLLIFWSSLVIAQPAAPVLALTQNGAIGPANADYLQRGLDKAVAINAQLVVLHFALRARRRPVVSGREEMLGATGEVIDEAGGGVCACIHGEMWKVRSNVPLRCG